MLLRADDDAVIAIGQASHAWLSGQLARAWGNERFGPVEPYEEVCLGAEQHDVGMVEWDLAPTLDHETGRPHSFLEMPLATHLELWSRAPSLMLPQSRYAALLVSLHGSGLYQQRDQSRMSTDDAASVRRYLAEQRDFKQRLIAELGEPPARVERNRRLVATWDSLSLGLCLDWAPTPLTATPSVDDAIDLHLAPLPGAPGRLRLDPWPFAAPSVRVHCEGRRLEGRFTDEEEMRAALAQAPWVTVRFELVADS